jgi:iron complex transport system permease protein
VYSAPTRLIRIHPARTAIVIMLRLAGALNALALGEAEARHLGIDVEGLKRAGIALAALAVGCQVAVSEMIFFVGLVAPPVVRLACGPDHRIVLPGAALAGAVLLVVADAAARVVVAPAELPIGVLTAAIGAPFFIMLLLLLRERRLRSLAA